MCDGDMKLYSYFITILEFVHVVLSICFSFTNLLHKYTPKVQNIRQNEYKTNK